MKQPEDLYSVERYLGSGAIKGIGEALAGRIVKKFKENTFRIIEEEPERLAEIKGISERMAKDIYRQFEEKRDMRQRYVIFYSSIILPVILQSRYFTEYGQKMYEILKENPYRLAEDIAGSWL